MRRRDAPTGLWDKETFAADLPDALAAAHKSGQPLSLVMVDVDRFKLVNDSHGHQRGDAVLAELAQRLRRVVKGKGDAYRFGGEEMLLVLPNHTVQEAVAVAERARRELEREPVDGLAITASFGVSTLPEHAEDMSALVEEADQAMYDAKNRGRNLVRVAREPDPPRPGPREPERRLPEPGRLTEEVKQRLRLEHLRGTRIRCPEDEAVLLVDDVTTNDSIRRSGGPELIVRCPACGLREALSGPARRA